jgi:hypothetical protein
VGVRIHTFYNSRHKTKADNQLRSPAAMLQDELPVPVTLRSHDKIFAVTANCRIKLLAFRLLSHVTVSAVR